MPEKKKRGRPRKDAKKTTQKQTTKTQTQKQTIIVNVGGRGRGRPRKAAQAVPIIPQTIIRMNEPPAPLPFQPVQPVREPLKAVEAPSVREPLAMSEA